MSRDLPADLNAERALLGALLISPAAWVHVNGLDPSAFFLPAHQHLFAAMARCYDADHGVDLVTVTDELQTMGLLEQVGGRDILAELMADTPGVSNAGRYVAVLAEHAHRRQVITIASELHTGVLEPGVVDRLVELARVRAGEGFEPAFIPAVGVRSELQRWVWQDRLPAGEITTAGGMEKRGKSTALVWASAALTRGLLPGDFHGEPRGVLYVSGEDHAGRALKPRLQLAGADLELVHFLNPDGPGFSVAAVVDLLERQAVTMVVLDPMSLFVDVAAPLENGELATRQALKPLVRLAQEHGLAVVGIKHLRKEPSGSNPFDAIIGSRAYTAASRSVLFFTRDPENAGRAGGLIYSRGNYAAATDGVRYRLDVDSVELDDGNLGRHPLFVAEESVSSRTLEEVLGASATREDTSETAACTRWLDDFLYGQPPIDSREVKERADDEGFSEKMLRRAREELGVVVEHTGFGRDKRSYWSLPTSINALDAHKCPSPDEGIYGE